MLDSDDLLFTVTDLKQYIYCPRILYYQTCLPNVRPITYNMQAGIDAHTDERKRAARRSLNVYGDNTAQRWFDVSVQSAALALSGQIDEVVETATELIPIDYKLTRKAGQHFKVQLTAYAMLLEDTRHLHVKRGFLYLIPTRQSVEVSITSQLRRQVHEALKTMRNILEREQMPAPTPWQQRCLDCEFRRFCNDI